MKKLDMGGGGFVEKIDTGGFVETIDTGGVSDKY